MSRQYYSDRMRGPRARTGEELTPAAWGGIVSVVERGIGQLLFAEDFPELCPDGAGACGCDRRTLGLAVEAEIPDLRWPLNERDPPPTLAALDLLELIHEHASAPVERGYHGYFSHYHYDFNRQRGQQQLREYVNRVLARSALVFELGDDGRVRRLTSPAVQEQLRHRLPPTRDARFDELVEQAVAKFTHPDSRVRREALQDLWDAFERMKTILDADKRRGAAALIRAATATATSEEASLLEDEMTELTKIGNRFRIRHHETAAVEPSLGLVDHLFGRMYALVYHVHPGLR